MKRYAGLFQLVHQMQEAGAYRVTNIVIPFGLRFVENKFRRLVDLSGARKGPSHVVGSKCIVPGANSISAGRLVPRPEWFVHDVPLLQLARVATDHLLDITL